MLREECIEALLLVQQDGFPRGTAPARPAWAVPLVRYTEGEEGTMEAYTSFAQVNDLFMDNVPYEEW